MKCGKKQIIYMKENKYNHTFPFHCPLKNLVKVATLIANQIILVAT